MSNIGELKEAVFEYLNVEAPSVIDGSLDLGGSKNSRESRIDTLLYIAANNARKRAEKKHDFSFADVTLRGIVPTTQQGLSFNECYQTPRYEGTLTISGGAGVGTLVIDETEATFPYSNEGRLVITDQGGTFTRAEYSISSGTSPSFTGVSTSVETTSEAVIGDGTYTVWCFPIDDEQYNFERFDPQRIERVKTIHSLRYYDADATRWRPIRYTNRKTFNDMLTEHLDRRPDDTITFDEQLIIVAGKRFYTYPDSDDAVDLRIECSRWLPNYKDPSDTDEFLQDAMDYMIWACVVELNRLTKSFVIRQDGNLPPPTTARDEALQEFIAADIYQDEENQNFVME